MQSESRQGQIVTFYSYKGGTGRSMALANIAWILASNRKRVFVIDWDLEAPGLHRYFRPFLIDKELLSSNGLIDIVHSYVDEIIGRNITSPNVQSPDYLAILAQFAEAFISDSISLNHIFPDGGFIDFLPAGRQIPAYAQRVNTFSWQEFYLKFGGGVFLESVKSRLREEYDFILIDSRTGVSDTSGISTVQMPDTLAVCFTYNNQSIAGAAAIARSVVEERQRFQSEQTLAGTAGITRNKFRILPIPTRVEQGERAKLEVRQAYARQEFKELLETMSDSEREQYWTDVEVPYLPFHAYEESLATLTDNPNDIKLILGAVRRITSRLTNGEVNEYQQLMKPEELERVLKEFSATPYAAVGQAEAAPVAVVEKLSAEALADAQLARVAAGDLNDCMRLWKRLVEIRAGVESESISGSTVEYAALGETERRVAGLFIEQGLLGLKRNSQGTEVLEVASDSLLRNWKTLRTWVAADRPFLIWRTQLSDWRRNWEGSARSSLKLLNQLDIDSALAWRRSNEMDLLPDDRRFIDESVSSIERVWNRKATLSGASLALGAIVLTVAPLSVAVYQTKAIIALQQQSKASPQAKAPTVAALEPVAVVLPPASGNAVSNHVAAVETPAVAEPDPRRNQITIRYFAKASDPPSISQVLFGLGYRVETARAQINTPTNSLWFGCKSPLSAADARIIGLSLLEQGINLKQMLVFRGPDKNLPVLELGAQASVAGAPSLTKDDVISFDLDVRCGAKPAKR